MTNKTHYRYLIGYACPNGGVGREFIRSPYRLETDDDINNVQVAIRRAVREPDAVVLAVSLLSGPDGVS